MDDTLQKSIDAYSASLDAALIAYMEADDISPFDSHCERHGIAMPSNGDVKKCAIMKIVTGRINLPMDVRSRAKKWLCERGFQSEDDGDVTY